jgi:hypothetical protein
MERLSIEDQAILMKNSKIQILEQIHQLTIELYRIEEAEILLAEETKLIADCIEVNNILSEELPVRKEHAKNSTKLTLHSDRQWLFNNI